MTSPMKKTWFLLVLLGIAVAMGSCIMEDRIIQLVLTDKSCADFSENQTSTSFVTPARLEFGEELNRILEDNDVAREEIVHALLVSASYGVTNFTQSTAWVISGSITVEREDEADGPKTLIAYSNLSVADALGKVIPAPLDSAGVHLINRATADYLAGVGSNPVLIFKVNNSSVVPSPSVSDPIQFDWRFCITMDVVTETDAEVPDPF